MNRNTTHYDLTRRWNAESKRAATRHGQMWTADEIEFIREHLGTITAREMAKHLGRSLHAVNVMRRDLRQGARRAVSPPGERREQRIVEIIADLDNIGVPRDTGRHAASRILKEAGLNATNIDAIGDAVRRRKGNPIRTRDGVSLGGVDELIDILDLLGLPDIAGRPHQPAACFAPTVSVPATPTRLMLRCDDASSVSPPTTGLFDSWRGRVATATGY